MWLVSGANLWKKIKKKMRTLGVLFVCIQKMLQNSLGNRTSYFSMKTNLHLTTTRTLFLPSDEFIFHQGEFYFSYNIAIKHIYFPPKANLLSGKSVRTSGFLNVTLYKCPLQSSPLLSIIYPSQSHISCLEGLYLFMNGPCIILDGP